MTIYPQKISYEVMADHMADYSHIEVKPMPAQIKKVVGQIDLYGQLAFAHRKDRAKHRVDHLRFHADDGWSIVYDSYIVAQGERSHRLAGLLVIELHRAIRILRANNKAAWRDLYFASEMHVVAKRHPEKLTPSTISRVKKLESVR